MWCLYEFVPLYTFEWQRLATNIANDRFSGKIKVARCSTQQICPRLSGFLIGCKKYENMIEQFHHSKIELLLILAPSNLSGDPIAFFYPGGNLEAKLIDRTGNSKWVNKVAPLLGSDDICAESSTRRS